MLVALFLVVKCIAVISVRFMICVVTCAWVNDKHRFHEWKIAVN